MYPTGPLSFAALVGLMIPAIAVGWWLKRRRVQNFWAYVLVPGGLSWAALYLSGIHPALALVPIVPLMPHAARDLGLFDAREDSLPDTMNRFEHWWKAPVQVILFFFGLANAGVELSRVGPPTWIVLSSLVIGKPLGVFASVWIASIAGLRLAGGLTLRDTIVVGAAAGIGFTVALFFATAAFPPGVLLDEMKMGALLSFTAGLLAILLAAIAPSRASTRPATTANPSR